MYTHNNYKRSGVLALDLCGVHYATEDLSSRCARPRASGMQRLRCPGRSKLAQQDDTIRAKQWVGFNGSQRKRFIKSKIIAKKVTERRIELCSDVFLLKQHKLCCKRNLEIEAAYFMGVIKIVDYCIKCTNNPDVDFWNENNKSFLSTL